MASHLKPGAKGLDYGCGPGPTLSILMQERGFSCIDYDPFFKPDMDDTLHPKGGGYDYIVSSEVFEHFHDPRAELKRLDSLLVEGGVLGVMTNRVKGEVNDKEFGNWYYRLDPTHVIFWARESFEYAAKEYFGPGATVGFPTKSVCIIRKAKKAR